MISCSCLSISVGVTAGSFLSLRRLREIITGRRACRCRCACRRTRSGDLPLRLSERVKRHRLTTHDTNKGERHEPDDLESSHSCYSFPLVTFVVDALLGSRGGPTHASAEGRESYIPATIKLGSGTTQLPWNFIEYVTVWPREEYEYVQISSELIVCLANGLPTSDLTLVRVKPVKSSPAPARAGLTPRGLQTRGRRRPFRRGLACDSNGACGAAAVPPTCRAKPPGSGRPAAASPRAAEPLCYGGRAWSWAGASGSFWAMSLRHSSPRCSRPCCTRPAESAPAVTNTAVKIVFMSVLLRKSQLERAAIGYVGFYRQRGGFF